MLEDVVREMNIARLGQGVDRTGMLAPEALERTFAIIDQYARTCTQLGVERLRMVATSATRDASNAQEFVDGVVQRLGVAPEVITGNEEARLSFTGAVGRLDGVVEPVLVVDIGGGSTEFVLGSCGDVDSAVSMNVGSVRMRERHLHHDPAHADEIRDARADVDAAVDAALATVPIGKARTVVGVAGTITSVTAEALGLPAYDPEAINGTTLSLDQINDACNFFLTAPAQERAARGHMHPGRVDVIPAGALVWSQIAERIRQETAADGHEITQVTTSEHDILDGIVLSIA